MGSEVGGGGGGEGRKIVWGLIEYLFCSKLIFRLKISGRQLITWAFGKFGLIVKGGGLRKLDDTSTIVPKVKEFQTLSGAFKGPKGYVCIKDKRI